MGKQWRAVAALVSAALFVVPAAAFGQGPTPVTLSGAQFRGLTEIAVTTSADLTGITAGDVTIAKPGGGTVPAGAITGVHTEANRLVVDIAADQYARTTSEGTTIATRAFGTHAASPAVPVARRGEPAANAHILGASRWTDNGWSTQYADPATSFYWFQDITPNADEANQPLAWNNGNVATPAHRNLRILMVFVDFPDRRAADAQEGWTTLQPYLDFFQPTIDYLNTSSYGQLKLSLEAPQVTRNLGWIRMPKNAADYPWGTSTSQMFAYSRDAFQQLYDDWDVKADDYDQVVIVPARGRTGLSNGPTNINSTNSVAYVDKDGKNHYVSTVLTAGNDMFSWGYRWMLHEWGHSVGLPDLYIYSPTNVLGTRVNQFFWVGGWDIMGNIGGHATDYTAWDKYKLKWIRDDQVDVVSQPGTSEHSITPLGTPGGTKMVVVRTGLTTAYVVEFRTKLGVDGFDNRARYQGALLYKVDTAQWQQLNTQPAMEIMSKQYYNDPAVGGPENRNGVWRPVSSSLSGIDNQGALWGPGDVFEDPSTGVKIDFGQISNYLAADPANSPYTANDTATVAVTKTKGAQLDVPVTLNRATLTSPTQLRVETSVELRRRAIDSSGSFITRQRSGVTANDLVITRGDRSVVPAAAITSITVGATGIDVRLAPGTFTTQASAAGTTVQTKAFYYFQASAPVPVGLQIGDVGGSVPATLALTLGAPASFGAFTPGVAKVYTASTTANVISTAGDAALTASGPHRLANGAFTLAEPVRITIDKPAWTGPVSNDPVNIGFSQAVGSTEALRTGTYSATVTFTLSTTTP